MDIKARTEELERQHDEQEAVYLRAQEQMNQARTNLIKLEGGLEILRELAAEETESK